MPKAQWRDFEDKLRKCLEGGMTDAETAKHLSKKGRKITVHQVRSKRGRMERAGTFPRGVAASSRTNSKGAKLPKLQRWSKRANALLAQMVMEGKSFSEISAELVRQKLRKVYNPKATACQASKQGFLRERNEARISKQLSLPVAAPASRPVVVPLPTSRHTEAGKETMVLTFIPANGAKDAVAFTMSRRDADLVIGLCQWMKERDLVQERVSSG